MPAPLEGPSSGTAITPPVLIGSSRRDLCAMILSHPGVANTIRVPAVSPPACDRSCPVVHSALRASRSARSGAAIRHGDQRATPLRRCRVAVRQRPAAKMARSPRPLPPDIRSAAPDFVSARSRLRCSRRTVRCVSAGAWPNRNTLPSSHIRCMIVGNLRATATAARLWRRRLATRSPHAFNAGRVLSLVNSTCAASKKVARISASPIADMCPSTSMLLPDWMCRGVGPKRAPTVFDQRNRRARQPHSCRRGRSPARHRGSP